MGDFKKLEVWQLSHSLACDVYRSTVGFPKTEAYGLTSQLRRAAASIPANIAEGCGRSGDVEFGRFVRISLGSATELEYHLLLSKDIGLLDESTHVRLSAQAKRTPRDAGWTETCLEVLDPNKPIANSQ
jgi:four helix bundle protein